MRVFLPEKVQQPWNWNTSLHQNSSNTFSTTYSWPGHITSGRVSRQPVSMAVGAASWISALPAWADNFAADTGDGQGTPCDVSHQMVNIWLEKGLNLRVPSGYRCPSDVHECCSLQRFVDFSLFERKKVDTVHTDGLSVWFSNDTWSPAAIWDRRGCQADMCDFVLINSLISKYCSRVHKNHT